jgi:hypothetical protein
MRRYRIDTAGSLPHCPSHGPAGLTRPRRFLLSDSLKDPGLLVDFPHSGGIRVGPMTDLVLRLYPVGVCVDVEPALAREPNERDAALARGIDREVRGRAHRNNHR